MNVELSLIAIGIARSISWFDSYHRMPRGRAISNLLIICEKQVWDFLKSRYTRRKPRPLGRGSSLPDKRVVLDAGHLIPVDLEPPCPRVQAGIVLYAQVDPSIHAIIRVIVRPEHGIRRVNRQAKRIGRITPVQVDGEFCCACGNIGRVSVRLALHDASGGHRGK